MILYASLELNHKIYVDVNVLNEAKCNALEKNKDDPIRWALFEKILCY